jgi:lysophospholipase L1-like esterase
MGTFNYSAFAGELAEMQGRTAAQLSTTPSESDIRLGDAVVFYDKSNPALRYTMNSGRTAFVQNLSASNLSYALTSIEAYRRTTPIKVATFGDSTADVGNINATSNATDQSRVSAPIPASGVTALAQNTDKWQLPHQYPSARLVAKGGISGENTTQMLARDAIAASATRRAMFDVISARPDVVILRGGSINDISGFTTATSQATIDSVFTRHMRIVETFLSFGVSVIDEGFYGYDASGGTPPSAPNLAFVRATLVALNARYKAAILALPGARFIDTSGITHDGTGAYLAGTTLSSDGTHLTAAGQYRMAQAESAELTAWYGPSPNVAYPGANLFGSAALFHTPVATGGYGNAQAGFTWSASACTRHNADVVQRDGRRWAICEGVPSGANPALMVYPTFDVDGGAATMPLVKDHIYGIEADYFIETLDGAILGAGATLTASMSLYNVTNAGRLNVAQTTASAGTPSGNQLIGKLVFPPFVAPENSADIGSSSELIITWKGAAAGDQSFRAGLSAPRFVDITSGF